MQIPAGALLDLAYTVEAASEREAPPVRFRVVSTDAAGVEHLLLDRVVDLQARVEDRR